MELSYTDLKIYPLEPAKMYSFVYNNNLYSGQFIGKKNKSFQTEFLFKEFVFHIHHIQPFNVLFFKECNSACSNESFTDSDSEYESDSECDQDIIDEYDIVEMEEVEHIFIG